MVRLVNDTFQCLVSFNVDLRALYDEVYNLLRSQRQLLTTESTFKIMIFDKGVSTEFQVIVEQIYQLLGLSSQVIKNISDTSKCVDEMRYKISKVKLLLSSHIKELNNVEKKLTLLVKFHANKEQDLEQLTAQKDAKAAEAIRC